MPEPAVCPAQGPPPAPRTHPGSSNGGSMKTSPRFSLAGSNAPSASHPERLWTSTWGPAKQPPQQEHVLRMKFAASQPIGWAQQRPDQSRRAGIQAKRLDKAEISGQRRPAGRREAGVSPQSASPVRRAASAVRSYWPAPAWVSSTKYGAGFRANESTSATSKACLKQSAKFPA